MQVAGVPTFVHASTDGVYGCRHQPFVETDPLNPMDLYSLTKAQAELAVQATPGAFHKIVLRYFFPYGVGTPNPIPIYVQRALTGEPIQILQSGKPITLGSMEIILASSQEITLRAFITKQYPRAAANIFTKDKLLAQLSQAQVGARNAAAHDGVLTLDDARVARQWALEILGYLG